MEHAQPFPTTWFPWRLLAVGELVALLAVGAVHFWPRAAAPAAVHLRPAAHHRVAVRPAPTLRPRSHVRVLVLNGNGVAGAAGIAARQLRGDGYAIGGATNAQRNDYATSMVMYAAGWAREAQRLARDAHVRVVAPVDGVRPRGATVILILGRT